MHSDPKASDPSLLERIAARDAQALADLYDRFAGVALALAGRILGDRSEAEDVLQTVLTRVWKEAARYDPSKGSPAAWILSWVRHAAIDRLRRRDVQRRVALQSAERGRDDEPAAALSAEDRERVSRAVEELPEEQRRAIELAYYEGMSQSQIAQRLGEPLGTVKTRMRLGMMKLRLALPAPSGGTK